jgi:hypothetical protein
VLPGGALVGPHGSGLAERFRHGPQEAGQVIAKRIVVCAFRGRLFFDGADAPELDERIGITLEQVSEFDVRLGPYQVRIGSHDGETQGK